MLILLRPHILPVGGAQADLRQYVNDLLLKTGGVAAPGNPVITCKLYPVRPSTSIHLLHGRVRGQTAMMPGQGRGHAD